MSSKGPPPPPVARGTKPGVFNRLTPSIVVGDDSDDGHGRNGPDRIDWANLSQEDKRAFFAWLDEFFANYLTQTGRPVPESVQRSIGEYQADGGSQDDAGVREVEEKPAPLKNVVAGGRRLPPPASSLSPQSTGESGRGPPVSSGETRFKMSFFLTFPCTRKACALDLVEANSTNTCPCVETMYDYALTPLCCSS